MKLWLLNWKINVCIYCLYIALMSYQYLILKTYKIDSEIFLHCCPAYMRYVIVHHSNCCSNLINKSLHLWNKYDLRLYMLKQAISPRGNKWCTDTQAKDWMNLGNRELSNGRYWQEWCKNFYWDTLFRRWLTLQLFISDFLLIVVKNMFLTLHVRHLQVNIPIILRIKISMTFFVQ